MAIRNYQRAFNGGEVSPSMFSRIDDGKYQTGLALCKNFLVEPQGPIANRPGFAYVNSVKEPSKPPRLIPFTFSSTQTMVLEVGEKYIRFHTEGATVLGNNGLPYEVTTPYMIKDVFDIHYVQSGDIMTLVHPYYPPKELRRYGPTDWRLVDINFRSTLSPPTNVTAVQSINGEVTNKEDYTREYAVTALLADGSQESARSSSASLKCNPYGNGAYNTISWNASSGAALYRVYRNQGGIWAYIGQTTSLSIVDENIAPDASITPPIYDDSFSMAKGIESVSVTSQGSGYDSYKYVSGYENKVYDETGNIFLENAKIPYTPWPLTVESWGEYEVKKYMRITVYDRGGSGTGATARPIFEVQSGYWNLVDIEITNGGSNYVNPWAKIEYYTWRGNKKWYVSEQMPLTLSYDEVKVSCEVDDPTGIGAVLTPLVSGGKVTGIRIDSGGTGYTNPKVRITANRGSGATATATVTSSGSGDYPGAVSYFEQRRWFAGTPTRPNHLWATKSGTESDMSYSLPSQDDDRIAVRVAAREANRIRHIVPLSQLMLLTGSAEWRVSPLNSDAITPSSMSVRPQSYVGANNVQPLVVGSSMIYAQERGGHLRECGYSYEAGGYITNDVCLRAPHLFDNLTIVDMAYAKAPYPVVFALSSNGKLIALTYVPEQQVGAFSTIETNGEFKSCCIVSEGDEDVLYVTVSRIINGMSRCFVERMHERQYTKLEDCMYLDCSGTYRGEPKTEISGLTWLEGETVSILANGSVEPRQKVVNGKITLNQASSIVHVGLAYNADVQTLPVALALQDGSYGSGHRKNVTEMHFRIVNSSGVKAGPSFDKLTEYPARGIELAGSPPSPTTGEISLSVNGKWTKDGQICVRQGNPLPLRIISMTTVLELT